MKVAVAGLIVLCLKCKWGSLIRLQDPSHTAFKEKMKEFMASFDKNSDGRIEMLEVRTDLMILSHDRLLLGLHPCGNVTGSEVHLSSSVLMCPFLFHAPVGSAFAHRRKLPAVFQGVRRLQLWVYGCEFVHVFFIISSHSSALITEGPGG